MKLAPALIVLCALVLSAASAQAWDPLGHQLIARIAEEQLIPAAKQGVAEAMKAFNEKEKSTYDFVSAACWMDDIRARTREFNRWHYVNLPFTPEGTPVPKGSKESPDLVWAMQQCEEVLEGDAPSAEKAEAMVMLLHLVGDVHQPLHTTDNKDSGGNRVEVGNLDNPEVDLLFSKGNNLHFFWDSAYRREYADGKVAVAYEGPIYLPSQPLQGHQAALDLVNKEAASIMREYPPEVVAGQGDPESWALQSHEIGFAFAYGKLPEAGADHIVTLDQPYVEKAAGLARKQVAIAGYRLGALLNRNYGGKE